MSGIQVEHAGKGSGGVVSNCARICVETSDDLYEIVRDAAAGDQLILDMGLHTPSQVVVLDGKEKLTIRGPRGAWVQPPAGQSVVFKFEQTGAQPNECVVLEGFTILGRDQSGAIIEMNDLIFNVFFRNLQVHGLNSNAILFDILDDVDGCKIESCILRGKYTAGVQAVPSGQVRGLGVVNCHFNPENGTGHYGVRLVGSGCIRNRILNNWFEGLGSGVMNDAIYCDTDVLELLVSQNIIMANTRAMYLRLSDSQVVNNIVRALGGAAAGIVTTAGGDNTIGQNRVKVGGIALTEAVGCDNNLWIGNNVRGSGTPTSFSGTNRTEIGTKA